jgi:hypothetical protein
MPGALNWPIACVARDKHTRARTPASRCHDTRSASHCNTVLGALERGVRGVFFRVRGFARAVQARLAPLRAPNLFRVAFRPPFFREPVAPVARYCRYSLRYSSDRPTRLRARPCGRRTLRTLRGLDSIGSGRTRLGPARPRPPAASGFADAVPRAAREADHLLHVLGATSHLARVSVARDPVCQSPEWPLARRPGPQYPGHLTLMGCALGAAQFGAARCQVRLPDVASCHARLAHRSYHLPGTVHTGTQTLKLASNSARAQARARLMRRENHLAQARLRVFSRLRGLVGPNACCSSALPKRSC